MEMHDVSTVVDAVENEGCEYINPASYDKNLQAPLF
jgi:hypothetical protein